MLLGPWRQYYVSCTAPGIVGVILTNIFCSLLWPILARWLRSGTVQTLSLALGVASGLVATVSSFGSQHGALCACWRLV